MEGAALQNPAADHPAPPRDTARDVWSLVLLLLLATAVRAWLVGHTEVAARDSIGYIRYALNLEHEPWEQALRRNEQHPGYPAALLAV